MAGITKLVCDKHAYGLKNIPDLEVGKVLVFDIGQHRFDEFQRMAQAYANRAKVRITSSGYRGVSNSSADNQINNFVVITRVE